jgi:Phosphoglycerate dehydrogenase and related dehydrogenases
MDNNTILVLSDPTDRQLAMLDSLPDATSIAVGNNLEAFERLAPEAQVILNWSGSRQLVQQVWKLAPRVKWVHSRAAGLDGLLFPELVESPALLTNGSGVFSQSLGEFVIASALFFAKDFRRMMRNQAAGIWAPFDVEEVAGQTMGIVGYGDIGRACSRRAHAMGMKVLALRRRPERSEGDEFVDRTYGFDRLLDMLPECDYVVAAAPLTPQTRHMIGEAAISAMKKTAVVMNVGRGPVIDEAALVRALETGRIRGAALDVFEAEPLPAESPLYKLENVLLSPHCADHTADWLDQAMRFFIQNYARYAAGEPLLNVVDKKAGY